MCLLASCVLLIRLGFPLFFYTRAVQHAFTLDLKILPVHIRIGLFLPPFICSQFWHFFSFNAHYDGTMCTAVFVLFCLTNVIKSVRYTEQEVSACHTWVIAWEAWCQRSYIRSKDQWKCWMQSAPGWGRSRRQFWLRLWLSTFEEDSWIIKCPILWLTAAIWVCQASGALNAKLLYFSMGHMSSLRDRGTWIRQ